MLKPDNLPVTFGKNDVEIIARETLYRGFFSLDLYRFRHRLFGNDSNLLIVFYVQRAFTDKQQIKRKAQSFD